MGAGDTFGVEPPVIACGKFKGQLFVLNIILTDVYMKAVRGNVMQRFACDFLLFLIFAAAFTSDITEIHQFLFDFN